MQAHLEAHGIGQFAVQGELDFDTIEMLWREARIKFGKQPFLRIDLGGVRRADSAGVALLVEWLREAKAQSQELCFVNVPAQMLAIMRVTGLEELLPLR